MNSARFELHSFAVANGMPLMQIKARRRGMMIASLDAAMACGKGWRKLVAVQVAGATGAFAAAEPRTGGKDRRRNSR
jgi:hypothetical protein